jgi:hypothetical protein
MVMHIGQLKLSASIALGLLHGALGPVAAANPPRVNAAAARWKPIADCDAR